MVQIDWMAVGLAAILNMIIGFFWYSKWMFGKEWLRWKRGEGGKYSHKTIFLAWVNSFLIAFFIAFFEGHLKITNVTDGMFIGFCFWLGFVMTTQIGPYLWEGESGKLFLLHTSCKLLSFLVMGGILGA